MKEIEKICQEQEEKRLSKNKREYDHVIKLMQKMISSFSLILTQLKK